MPRALMPAKPEQSVISIDKNRPCRRDSGLDGFANVHPENVSGTVMFAKLRSRLPEITTCSKARPREGK